MHPFLEHRERVLTGSWTPLDGARVTSSTLPEPWLSALERLGHDLQVRQHGLRIEHIEWAAMYDPDGGAVWLESAVTVEGSDPGGLGGNGYGAQVDANVDEALVSMADLVQLQVAEEHTAWPWGDEGGFMSPSLLDGVAVWIDRTGSSTPIGTLAEPH
ncbi:hypothetical protein CH305_04885 [Rhodococcus sp. 15-649-2-2]|uniref:hypothetical protein n=1 Tax=Rhodococcus sp. 15-649-2-2 TaxID=2023140 RepID=UPI000B9BDE7C|nr:hypothetical protein [Rhodococcus sp. 15-649-2-2]OZE85238.1 hypothetical protein CH305_04885 [Rhodococcus sp. 15-649-2-2]